MATKRPTLTFKELVSVMSLAQLEQAKRDARLCRCGQCLCCYVKENSKQEK